MEDRGIFKTFVIIFFASLILGLSFTYPGRDFNTLIIGFASFFIIIGINILAKKFFAYNLETDVNVGFWSWYHWGLRRSEHFKTPLPMIWLPILTSLITYGNLIWVSLIDFDVSPRPERVSRRHGLYRYTEVTEWHVALIATFGIFANIVLGVIAYFAGLEQFAKLSVLYAFWSIIPIGSLDGTKIFFGSRPLWYSVAIILAIVGIWGLSIV